MFHVWLASLVSKVLVGRESHQEPEYKASLFTLLLVTLSYYYRRSGNLFHVKNFHSVNFLRFCSIHNFFIYFLPFIFLTVDDYSVDERLESF